MVTATFVQSGGVALFAFAGMLLGFRVQEELRRRSEARVARRVEEGVEAAIAARLAAAAAAAPAAPPPPQQPQEQQQQQQRRSAADVR